MKRGLPTGTVTLLFLDIEGSTSLLQRLGESYAALLEEFRRVMREIWLRRDGCEVDTQGDAFFVAFASASAAIAAAVDIQRTLFEHTWPDDVSVLVRIGIHTGEPQRTSEGYIGLDVHHAARIMSAGYGGQVLLSRATRNLVEHSLPEGVNLLDLGEHRLKDIRGYSHIFQLAIAGLPEKFPPLKTPGSLNPLSSLLAAATPLVGRQQELDAIANILRHSEQRLLTLSGVGGVGKTRLALQVALELQDSFPDGVYFVNLSQVRDPERVVYTIVQELSIREERELPLDELLAAALRNRHALLILDNFEQVAGAAPLISHLLTACPTLRVLVTSRAWLRIQAERVFVVSPLTLPESAEQIADLDALARVPAVALFIQRARDVKPDFYLSTANAAAIAEICVRLDGLPLAIELAAARTRYFPPQTLLPRLERGLTTLAGGARDLPERQQTLRGAIAWSYELLEAEEQQLFRRLAVFSNGCTLEAAEQVCNAAGVLESDVLVLLEALVDKSLLQQREQAGEVRFWMLQVLRDYGLECLVGAEEVEAMREAHAAYYLALAEEAEPQLAGSEQISWLDRLEREHENLRAGFAWLVECAEKAAEPEKRIQLAEQALRLCLALVTFWETRGYFSEAQAFLTRALAISDGVKTQVRGQVLFMAGAFASIQGQGEGVESLLQESLELLRQSDDKASMAEVLRLQGSRARARGEYPQARILLDQAVALYEAVNDRRGMTFAHYALAQIFISQGNYKRARALLESNLAIYRSQNDKYDLAYPLYHLARLLFLSRGDGDEALKLARESLAIFNEIGNRRFSAMVMNVQALLLLWRSKPKLARPLLESALSSLRDLKDLPGQVVTLVNLARVEHMRGRQLAEAQTRYEESWHLVRKTGDREIGALCLEGLGEVLFLQGEVERAVQLWGSAAALRAAIVAPMPPVYRASYESAVVGARRKLGPAAFQVAWNNGREQSGGQLP